MAIAIIPVKISRCLACPHSMIWHEDNQGNKWYCKIMKGKSFRDPTRVQEWCPHKVEE